MPIWVVKLRGVCVLGEGLGEKMEENVCFMLLDVFVACKTRLGETLLAWAS